MFHHRETLTQPAFRNIIINAPSKINLMLHITRRLANGYHCLQSLCVMGGIVDTIIQTSDRTPPYPFTKTNVIPSNSIDRVRSWFFKKHPNLIPSSTFMHKSIPLQSGLGGGSSDAAATLIALHRYYNIPYPKSLIQESCLFGADVGVCCAHYMYDTPYFWVEGVDEMGCGQESIAPLFIKNPLFMLLIVPELGCSTPDVFKAYKASIETSSRTFDTPCTKEEVSQMIHNSTLLGFLNTCHNSLQEAALETCPLITDVLEALSTTTPIYRMSGSGSTCFGLYESEHDLEKASIKLCPFFKTIHKVKV